MRGSAVFRTGIAPGGALAGPWVRNSLWTAARAVPSLDLRFADNKSLVDAVTGAQLVTFTRASSGTFVGSDGVLRSAVTNLLLQSENFTTTWTNFLSTDAANTAIAPNGTLTADTLISNSGATAGLIRQDFSGATFTDNASISFSIYVKAAGLTNFNIQFYNKANTFHGGQTVNASTGALSGVGTLASTAVTSIGDGWYRVSVTGMSSGTGATSPSLRIVVTSTGDGTSGIYLWGAQLEQSATVGEYIPTTSVINSAPRFDHNPTTGESLGLLLEEARTNGVIGSADFSSTYTSLNNITTTVDTAVAPDGNTTGDTITGASSALNIKYFYKVFTTTATGAYTASIYLKSNTQSIVLLRLNDNTGINGVKQSINLSTGQLLGSVSIDGTATNPSSSITPVGNGWYRCTVTCTFNSAITSLQGPAVFHDGYTTSTSTNSYFAWGAQLEAGAFPTSYIPTTTATVTRAADVASITGSNFSSWYNQTEGTVFAEGSILNTSANRFIANITDSGVTEEIGLYWTTVFGSLVNDNGVAQANSFGGTVTANSRTLHSFGYKLNDFQGYGNGTALSTDTSGTLPTVDRLTIGSRVNSSFWLNGTIKRLVYWGQRLPNNVLQAITQ